MSVYVRVSVRAWKGVHTCLRMGAIGPFSVLLAALLTVSASTAFSLKDWLFV